MGPNDLDPKLSAGPDHLREVLAFASPSGPACAVCIQKLWHTTSFKQLTKKVHTVPRRLTIIKLSCWHVTASIIYDANEAPFIFTVPLMMGPIHLQENAFVSHPLPLYAGFRWTSSLALTKPCITAPIQQSHIADRDLVMIP
jgi:hypothetical protein